MVFSLLHWLPSAIAAVLAVMLAIVKGRRWHRLLGSTMAVFALVGLLGYLEAGSFRFTPLDFHTLHAIVGIVALVLSSGVFIYATIAEDKRNIHCWPGYLAAAFALTSLLMGLMLLLGAVQPEPGNVYAGPQLRTASTLPEVEASEFQGVQLTPLSQQGNNAISGTQYVDRQSYRLQVAGAVERPLNLTYDGLLAFPAYSEAAYMPCVEGWGFNAKWTGFRVADLLERAGAKPEAHFVIFYSVDGYATSLPIEYVRKNSILLAYGINDLTLPAERGFPLQLVAKSKYGYKWGKWIDRIEVSAEDRRGYWESRGYSNSANVGEFPYE